LPGKALEFFWQGGKARGFGGEVLFCASEHLTAVGGVFSDYCGDLFVFEIKNFTQQENKALLRRQTFTSTPLETPFLFRLTSTT
jgi:hypothetical protein